MLEIILSYILLSMITRHMQHRAMIILVLPLLCEFNHTITFKYSQPQVPTYYCKLNIAQKVKSQAKYISTSDH